MTERKGNAVKSKNTYTKGKARLQAKRKKNRRKKELKKRCLIVLAVLITAFVSGFFYFTWGNEKKGSLTEEVLRYRENVEQYCAVYKIEEFSELILAMMQQESAGQGTDVMQCSESPFNTLYPNEPGSILDVDYSIKVGVETFAYCLEQAKCESVKDMERVKLALQEYNFGNQYAIWAAENYGGYSEENAAEYSEKMKMQLGWKSYGDPRYVSHVLRYY